MENGDLENQENENQTETQKTDEVQNQTLELDTSYQTNVLHIMDSINTYCFLNIVLVCVLIGCLLGGALWKRSLL